MKILRLFFTYSLLLGALLATSCSNKDEGFPESQIPTGGNDDLKPGPGNPSDPNDPGNPDDPTPPRETGFLTFETEQLSKDELKDLKAPYKNFWVKRWNVNETDDSKKCAENYKDRCVHNKQVVMQFDVSEINEKFPPQLWTIVYAKLNASYYSLHKNHRTELLCFLNASKCSGQVVEKIPGIGLGFIAKFFWWDKDFWKPGDENVLTNDFFHNLLKDNYNEDEKVYILKDSSLDVVNVFQIPQEQLQTLMRKENKVRFVVADDTYPENPQLQLKFKRKALKDSKK